MVTATATNTEMDKVKAISRDLAKVMVISKVTETNKVLVTDQVKVTNKVLVKEKVKVRLKALLISA